MCENGAIQEFVATLDDESTAIEEEDLHPVEAKAGMGVWEIDLITQRTRWSEGTYALFEVERNSKLAQGSCRPFIHPDDREMCDQAFKDAVEGRKAYDLQSRLMMKDGRIKWVHALRSIRRDAATGRALRFIGTLQGITERKHEEKKKLQNRILTAFAEFR
jgi:PAS domain S-box-containing protein